MGAVQRILAQAGHECVTERILGYLDGRSLFSVPLVNKHFHAVLSNSSRLQLMAYAAYCGHEVPVIRAGDTHAARLKRMRAAERAWRILDFKSIKRLPRYCNWIPTGDVLVSFEPTYDGWTVHALDSDATASFSAPNSFDELAARDDVIAVAEVESVTDSDDVNAEFRISIDFYTLDHPTATLKGAKPTPYPDVNSIHFSASQGGHGVNLKFGPGDTLLTWVNRGDEVQLWAWRTGKLVRSWCIPDPEDCTSELAFVAAIYDPDPDAVQGPDEEDSSEPPFPPPTEALISDCNGQTYKIPLPFEDIGRLSISGTSRCTTGYAGRILVIQDGQTHAGDMTTTKILLIAQLAQGQVAIVPYHDFEGFSTRVAAAGWRYFRFEQPPLPSRVRRLTVQNLHKRIARVTPLVDLDEASGIADEFEDLRGIGYYCTVLEDKDKTVKVKCTVTTVTDFIFKDPETNVRWLGADSERLYMETNNELYILSVI